MKTLTVLQPMAWAIFHAGKDIENRSWRPPVEIIGQRIAIHAGKKYNEEFARWIEGRLGWLTPAQEHFIYEAIIGTVIVSGVADYDENDGRGETSLWWDMHSFGWELADPRPIAPPVYCRGYQRLWNWEQ